MPPPENATHSTKSAAKKVGFLQKKNQATATFPNVSLIMTKSQIIALITEIALLLIIVFVVNWALRWLVRRGVMVWLVVRV